ncbi:hypothetical protein [Actibacterium sp. MT2.3-13A]|uniref:hypothetical protein n=1 Tax=Actibacterium sp. MT2.3-13A TaxID=2828332 RepID=UPI001BA96EC7|nr:hypothetical protein [Actibacterium sp. MT2.3-13A]
MGNVAQVQSSPSEQRAQYEAARAKSIIELQPFRSEQSASLPGSDATVRLISLNPAVNSWFLLQIGKAGAGQQKYYHLENPNPGGQKISLSSGPALKLTGSGGTMTCAPWQDPSALAEAAASRRPFAPICGGRLYLRNRAGGSTLSMARGAPSGGGGQSGGGPAPAALASPGSPQVIAARMGLGLSGTNPGQMTMGAWHPVAGLAGVFASALQPKAISKAVLQGPGSVNALDGVELGSTVYLVAFDLSRYDLGYAVGTQEPGLTWSSRPPASVRARGLPGPDGVGSPAPLVPLGMVSPSLAGRTVATFAGGFKRHHGAFKSGPLAAVNGGSHYGFVEQGAILSKLQPGLSTLFVQNNGQIEMKTWTSSDDKLLPKIRFARQNGVPLIEGGVPGRYVTQWGAGNWSGSAEAKLRTLRAGACMLGKGRQRYLAYAYFPAATPSAMARTFQAYGCQYAMLLDMNAPELTYLALYVNSGGKTYIEHLVPEMAASDRSGGAGVVPKFLGTPDPRDMFYIMRKGR